MRHVKTVTRTPVMAQTSLQVKTDFVNGLVTFGVDMGQQFVTAADAIGNALSTFGGTFGGSLVGTLDEVGVNLLTFGGDLFANATTWTTNIISTGAQLATLGFNKGYGTI